MLLQHHSALRMNNQNFRAYSITESKNESYKKLANVFMVTFISCIFIRQFNQSTNKLADDHIAWIFASYRYCLYPDDICRLFSS